MKYEVPAKVKEYLTYKHSVDRRLKSKHTVDSYNHDLHLFFSFYKEKYHINNLTNVHATEVKQSDIIEFISTSVNKSDATMSRRISALRSFYDYLVTNHVISENPVKNIKKPSVERKTPSYLTEKEIELVKSSINNERDLAIISVLINCGLRESEAVNLKRTDIVDGRLYIKGKGNQPRIVKLSQTCMKAIDDYLKTRTDDNKYLFITDYHKSKGIKQITASVIYDIVKKYGKQVKIDEEKLHPHALRHTFATLALSNGANIKHIQKAMGHKRVSTTEIYTTIIDKDVDDVFDRMNY